MAPHGEPHNARARPMSDVDVRKDGDAATSSMQ